MRRINKRRVKLTQDQIEAIESDCIKLGCSLYEILKMRDQDGFMVRIETSQNEAYINGPYHIETKGVSE